MLEQFPNLYRELHGDFMRPTTSRERAKMLIYGTIGSMMIYGSTKLTSNPLAENGALLVGASGLVLGVKQLYGATCSSYFPEAAKSYATLRIENGMSHVTSGVGNARSYVMPMIKSAKTIAESGVENAKYYGWCAGQSTINLVNSGKDNTEYLAWCVKQSTVNAARALVLATKPVVPSPTL